MEILVNLVKLVKTVLMVFRVLRVNLELKVLPGLLVSKERLAVTVRMVLMV